jgi:hypothetical protein
MYKYGQQQESLSVKVTYIYDVLVGLDDLHGDLIHPVPRFRLRRFERVRLRK